jgi:hypothetical protein
MITKFNQISLILFPLIIWFKTDAFIEYCELLRLGNLFKIDKYREYKKINVTIDYVTYLSLKHKNFLTKLLSCPYCIGFWITLLSCVLFNNILLLPFYYVSSIILYKFLDKNIL